MPRRKSRLDKSSLEFIESMGLVYQADNLPRIAGRIIGLLMVTDDLFTLQELADALEVSRGSISTNTRLLEQFGMTERVARSGERQSYYRLTDDPYSKVMRGAGQRLRKARDIVNNALKKIPKTNKGAQKNLKEISRFYDITVKGIDDIVDEYSGLK